MLRMDEILIGDKTYISSKRAASITGYAKDYIGQLCREGRVPARLVGRSWYVLESAIQDHRFGNPIEEAPVIEEVSEKPTESLPKTWESPRYEAAEGETLPSVNRLRDGNKELVQATETEESAHNLENSWQTWFSRIGQGEEQAAVEEEPVSPESVEPVEEPEKDTEAVEIPIHTVYELPPQEIMPEISKEREEKNVENGSIRVPIRRRGNRKAVATIQFAGAVIALLFASLAVVGSGYIDSYIISNSQARIIAGVSLYNK